MLEQLIRNQYVLEVLGPHPQCDWNRLAGALLVYGARQLLARQGNQQLSVTEVEELAYDSNEEPRSRLGRPSRSIKGGVKQPGVPAQEVERVVINQFTEELSQIKSELSKLDQKIQLRLSPHSGPPQCHPTRAPNRHVPQSMAESTDRKDLSQIQNENQSQTMKQTQIPIQRQGAEDTSTGNRFRTYVVNKPEACWRSESAERGRPPERRLMEQDMNMAARSCSSQKGRGTLTKGVYPDWWATVPEEPIAIHQVLPQKELSQHKRIRRPDSDRAHILAYSEAAKENAQRNYLVSGLQPVKMTFEKNEFTAPYRHRLPQPVVMTKTRAPPQAVQASPTEPPPLRPTTKNREAKKRRGRCWQKGWKKPIGRPTAAGVKEPQIAPKYLQNVQSRIKEQLSNDKRLSRGRKELPEPNLDRQSDGRGYSQAQLISDPRTEGRADLGREARQDSGSSARAEPRMPQRVELRMASNAEPTTDLNAAPRSSWRSHAQGNVPQSAGQVQRAERPERERERRYEGDPEPEPEIEQEEEQPQSQSQQQMRAQTQDQEREEVQEREVGNEGSMLEIAENFLSSSIINHFSREERNQSQVANDPERPHEDVSRPQDDRHLLRTSQEERSANGAIWQDRIDEESSCTVTDQTGRNESSSVHTSTLTQSNLQSDYQPREPRSNISASSEVLSRGLPFDSRHSAQDPPRGRIPTGIYMPNSKGHYSTDMRVDNSVDPEFTLNAPDPGLTKSYNYLIANN